MTDLSPESNPFGKHKAELPDADKPNLETDRPENGDALLQTIEGGIDDARARSSDVTEHTARAIARAIANALGDNGRALDEFARTGSGSNATLNEEYLEVYNDPTTPGQVRTWIDWFGTYLVQRENTGSGRQFMNEHLSPKLARLLVRTEVTVGGEQFTVHLPASYGEADITDLAETLKELSLDEDPGLQAFLSLPDVNAMSGNIMESFHEAFAGTYRNTEAALRALSPLEEWESDLAEWVIEQGVEHRALQWNLDPLVQRLRDVYDLVQWRGVFHAFIK
ncbi:hypothetical protein [Cryobacterium lyxosi]|uniref:Uncharacterized protein n=1 Tax=Cryobacterium lyxosi TaxID=1259228 RepID=A0A4R8ZGZ5_9MICO|nr:hypothetical protein [Cryobacterium lyxosi]TFD27338.1 hypothetical protein E3T27_06170 [Cryobacterium lyxosi]